MNCENLLRRLAEYEEGVLEGELCREIERHLGECRHCSELEQDLRDLSRLCHECDAPRLPRDVRQRIEERLKG